MRPHLFPHASLVACAVQNSAQFIPSRATLSVQDGLHTDFWPRVHRGQGPNRVRHSVRFWSSRVCETAGKSASNFGRSTFHSHDRLTAAKSVAPCTCTSTLTADSRSDAWCTCARPCRSFISHQPAAEQARDVVQGSVARPRCQCGASLITLANNDNVMHERSENLKAW